jgi:hypothetical protein
LWLIDSIPSSYPKSYHLCGEKMLLIPRYVTILGSTFRKRHLCDVFQTVCIRLRFYP